MDEQLLYRIGITLIDRIGDVTAKKLIAYCGSVEAVFRESKKGLLKIPGIGAGQIKELLSQNVLSRAEEEIRFMEKNGIRPLFYLDKEYPQRLKHCDDGPVMLYTRGKMDLNKQKVLSLVGTRKATSYGREMCEEIVESLKPHDVLIVSGLAYGIDICSHRSAVKNGLQTVAVVAHGLDMVYPQVHTNTLRQMEENGGVITEFLPGINPDRENFPKRNRIVAGICDAVLVFETKKRGGSMITAELANSYSRDVFAVPGRVGDVTSEGCNYLIRINKAALLESVKDIEYLMGWEINPKKKAPVQKKMFTDLSAEEEMLANLLKEKGKISVDKLCLEAGLSTSKVASLLLNLEFMGMVRSLPGKLYELS